MKIPFEIGKLKKCKECTRFNCTAPLEFKFNFSTLRIDCYWKEEYFSNNGQKTSEYWSKNNQWHRDDGPAVIWYFKNGKIESKVWYKNENFIKREI